MPEPERFLILASTSFEGSRGNHSAKEDKINAPKGSPIGLILMWIGEYHREGLEFDGFKITFRYLGIPPRPDSRWYSLKPALLDAFVEVPKAQNVTMDYATSAIKQNEIDVIKGVKVSAVNDGKIQLTGPVASLDSLDRWISIKFMKMVGEDHRKRRMPFPAGKNLECLKIQQHSLGAKAAMMGCGQSIDGDALREVGFHPSSEFWGGLGVKCHAFLESRLGGR